MTTSSIGLQLAQAIGIENTEIAMHWFSKHLSALADLELKEGNPEGAQTLQRVSYNIGESV